MKKLVSLFLALLMVLSFGLLTAASAEPKEIVFWTALAGAYNDVIQNICADFNATQDEWKVVPEYQGNYYDIAAKLQASLLDGSEPDIVQPHPAVQRLWRLCRAERHARQCGP